jgi:hypothetical protein
VGIAGAFHLDLNGPAPQTDSIVAPPNKKNFITVVSLYPLSDDEIRSLLALPEGIIVSLVIQYSGGKGTSYESDVCLGRLNSGAIAFTNTNFDRPGLVCKNEMK